MTKVKQSWGEFLSSVYGTPGQEGAFSSVEKLFHILKKNGYLDITRNQVKQWLDKTYTHTIHRFRKLKYKRNPTIAKYVDHIWQGDLLFLPELVTFNDRKTCILICVDVISRFAWGEPMMNKSGLQTAKAFDKILKRAKPRKPEKLHTDKGREFFNKDFKKLLKEKDIVLYSTESDMKAAIAERCIKEIKKLVYRYLTHNQTNRFIDVLPKIFETYNKTFHSSIGMEPVNVTVSTQGTAMHNLYSHLWSTDREKIAKFKVGDSVRLSLTKSAFTKGYKGFWTTEVFKIDAIKLFHPETQYRLMDVNGDLVDGLFYEAELQLALPETIRFTNIHKVLRKKLIKGRQWALVNWEGEDPKMTRWVPVDKISKL
jgi:transposase InsO family protein